MPSPFGEGQTDTPINQADQGEVPTDMPINRQNRGEVPNPSPVSPKGTEAKAS